MAEEENEEIEITKEEMTVVEIPEEESLLEDTPDGGAILKMEKITVSGSSPHFENIVEKVDQKKLKIAIYRIVRCCLFKIN